jgi:hypothetical protein
VRVGLGVALLVGAAIVGAFAVLMTWVGVAGNHAFGPELWAIVAFAGAVAVPSLIVGARLLKR